VAVYKKMGSVIRSSSRSLRSQLNSEERAAIVDQISKALIEHKKEILEANKKVRDVFQLAIIDFVLMLFVFSMLKDIEQAIEKKIDSVLRSRLSLDESKLNTLAKGISQIAASSDPIGRVIKKVCNIRTSLHLTRTHTSFFFELFESRRNWQMACIYKRRRSPLASSSLSSSRDQVTYSLYDGTLSSDSFFRCFTTDSCSRD